MAQNDKLFNYAGTARSGGELKVSFANCHVSRLKANMKRGHNDVNYYELPHAMQKREACEYLLKNVELDDEQRYAVTARIADLKKIERRQKRKNGEVSVITTADQLLKAIGAREKITR